MSYQRIKCTTPLYMKLDICKDCKIRAEKIKEGQEYEQYHPAKTRMNGWKCDMYEHKNQGDLF